MSETSAPASTTSPAPVASSDAGRVESREDFFKWLFSKTALSHSDQKLVRAAAVELLQSGRAKNQVNQAVVQFLREAERIFEEESLASREERKARAEAELQDQRERREAELQASEKRLTIELAEAEQDMEDRKAKRTREQESHEQGLLAKETEREDTSYERKTVVLLNKLIVISTIAMAACTLVLIALTAKYQQPWGYAGTGVGLALTGILGFGKISQQFQTLFALAKSGGATSNVASDSSGP